MEITASGDEHTELPRQNRQTANLFGRLHTIDHFQRMPAGADKISDQLASFTPSKVVLPGMRQPHPSASAAPGIHGLGQLWPVLFDITQLARAQPLAERFGAVLYISAAHQKVSKVRACRGIAAI